MARSVWSILVAGGQSSRLGGDLPKQFRRLGGLALYHWGLCALRTVGAVVVVVPADAVERVRGECAGVGAVDVVAGGLRRQDSVANGLQAVPDAVQTVLVHDAARPFVPRSLLTRVIDASKDAEMVLPVLPVPDTVKRSEDGRRVGDTVSRRGLFLAQTPQACHRSLLADIAAQRNEELTDEAQGAESFGVRPLMVVGSPFTFKITTSADFAMAEAVAHWLRTGRRDEDWDWIRHTSAD